MKKLVKKKDVEVRRADLRDAVDMVPLCAQLGYPTDQDSLQRRLEAILARHDHAVFVCASGGAVVAWLHIYTMYSMTNAPHAVIAGLVVDLSSRQQGLGKSLVKEAVKWARSQDLGQLRVRSDIRREDAHAFYEGLGFDHVKTSAAFVLQLDW